MSGFIVKGRCPDAWHPMAASDGLLVRIKPRFGRIERELVLALCQLAERFGNGNVDLTRRSNLQIRGVEEARWGDLVQGLIALGLVDPDPAQESRRTILLAPNWVEGDDTHRIAADLLSRLDQLPALPGKVGFAIDAGPAPVLRGEPGDFRIERATSGALILRADGRETGAVLPKGAEADALVALARWFASIKAKRMTHSDAPLPQWAQGTEQPALPASPLQPGGNILALPFGEISTTTLAQLFADPETLALRLTPWRMMIVEGRAPKALDGVITDPRDPLLRVEACPGAPRCPQASVATRDLARRLAQTLPPGKRLHVSGCAKHCAASRPADITLTGHDGRFERTTSGASHAPSL